MIESTDGNFGTHCHVHSSHYHSHFWHICVPIPVQISDPWYFSVVFDACGRGVDLL